MDKLDAKHLRVYYYQYKDTAIFSIAVSVCILLVNFIIFSLVVRPQYETWQKNNAELEEVKKKIDTLEGNNRILQSIDPFSLSTDLQLALAGLPPEQDYMGIMNAIASATTISGVILEDYGFRLGEIVPTKPDVVPVVVTVGIRGDANALHAFMKEIQQKVPTANLTTIDGSNDSTSVKLTFFSKVLPKIELTEDKVTTPLTAPSSSDRQLLEKLASWKGTLLPPDEFVAGSESADISPF